MGALKAVLSTAFAAVCLVEAAPAAASPVDRWAPFIAEASSRFGVPEGWIRRVMKAESGGRTHLSGRPVVSRAGAMGLMQLMPGTWREMRSALGLGTDPHDPRDNILAGTAYLRLMHDRFGYPGLFAAYNAGPARYASHLATGRRLPAETKAYLAAVAGTAGPEVRPRRAPEAVDAPEQPLFALRTSAAAAPAEPRALAAPSGTSRLFVPLGTAARE